jgi:hypothetical protein
MRTRARVDRLELLERLVNAQDLAVGGLGGGGGDVGVELDVLDAAAAPVGLAMADRVDDEPSASPGRHRP